MLVDRSLVMLERAAARIAASGRDRQLPASTRLVQADLLALPARLRGFTTILGLGVTHLFGDVPVLVGALRERLAPRGQVHLAGLVAATHRGRWYLEALHRAGEVAAPMRSEELRAALGDPASFQVTGCMAYARLAG